MKVLLVHTYYLQKGGEDNVFRQEESLLGGSENVHTLAFHNLPGWRGLGQFLCSLWNVAAARKVKKAIRLFRPDVVHFHNTHFALGPLAVRAARNTGVPVVVTLHNYRLLCPSGILFHDNRIFTESLAARFPWQAIRKKAYRNSYLLTFWLAGITWFHTKAGTWKKVDRFIVLTAFARELFVTSRLGIPENRIVVKPNFVDLPVLAESPRDPYFLFVGRLCAEKGVGVLLEACRYCECRIRIAGTGPMEPEVRLAMDDCPQIEYLGHVNHEEIPGLMARATALVFPSLWYEGMPMTIIEAMATGTPVIAGNLGAMSTMVSDGWNGIHYDAPDPGSLAAALRKWEQLPLDKKRRMSSNAFASFKECYAPENNRDRILAVYEDVLRERKQAQPVLSN